MAIRQHSLHFKLDKEYNKKVLLLLTFNYPNNYTEPFEAKNTDDNIEYHITMLSIVYFTVAIRN